MFPFCSGHYENIPTPEECQIAANLVTQDTGFTESVQSQVYPRYCVGAGYKWLKGLSDSGEGFEEEVAWDMDNHAFFNRGGHPHQLTSVLDARVIDGSLSSICRKKAADYSFTHYGYCATNHLDDYTGVFSIEECAWQCRANPDCGYFSYADGATIVAAKGSNIATCLLYPKASQCHDNSTQNPYKSYRLIDNCVPTFSNLNGTVVANITVNGNSNAELDHACCTECHANDDCLFWVREDGSSGAKLCQLKERMSGRTFTSKSRGNYKNPPLKLNQIARWNGNWRAEGDVLSLVPGAQNTDTVKQFPR
jgi:hypothetical protein